MGNQDDRYWIEYDLPGGGCLALTNFIPDAPSADAGGTIAFEVDDLDGLIADFKARGVVFRSDIIHGPKCRMINCLTRKAIPPCFTSSIRSGDSSRCNRFLSLGSTPSSAAPA